MAWDSSRPIPWNRLLKEAAVFLVLGTVIFALFLKNSNVGSYVGLVIGMCLYLGLSVVLAKYGYSRESMRENRARQMAARQSQSAPKATATSPMSRAKPPPTKRTSSGPSNRPKPKRR